MFIQRTAVAILGALISSNILAFNFQAKKDINICEKSAKAMHRSCWFETHEERNANYARCITLQRVSDRKACLKENKEEKRNALSTCKAQKYARFDACDSLAENRYSNPLEDDSIEFIDPNKIGDLYSNSPYIMLQTGYTHVLSSEDEIVVVYATDETREIQGVQCRVVVDIVLEEEYDEEEDKYEYEAIEVTDDWFAQDVDSNVYYCGEIAQNFESGILRDLDGSFESGVDNAMAGYLTLAAPISGQTHRQEYALGEAEDIVEYLSNAASPTKEEGGENENFPCENKCLKTFDYAPLEPESSEYKYYIPGVGFVLAVSLEDGEVDKEGREQLVCTGESLDILSTDACEIADPKELLEKLCELHDEFCDDAED